MFEASDNEFQIIGDMHSSEIPKTGDYRLTVTIVFPIALCLISLLMVMGCSRLFPDRSPKVRTVPVPKVSDEVVKLERRFSADGVAVNMDYDHPHEFSEETIRDEIGLLVVQRQGRDQYGVGSEWVSDPAFTKSATERLVPALVIAFKEASRSDKILFGVPGQTGQPTSGEVYLQDDELVWIFREIDGRTFLGQDPFRLDSGDWTIEEKPYLAVRNNKHAGVIKVIHHLRGQPETLPEITEKRPSSLPEALSMEAREAVVTPGEVISSGSDKLREEKLHALKKWKDAGLITDEDYEKEKAKILQPLQQP